MKAKILFLNLLFFFTYDLVSQNLKASIESEKSNNVHNVDTIKVNNSSEYTYKFFIEAEQNSSFLNSTLSFEVVENDFSVNTKKIFLPSKREMIINNSSSTMRESFTIKFIGNSKDDRVIKLKLNGRKPDGTNITFDSASKTELTLYIKPFKKTETKRDNEFWLFTGTNIDLLDGVKAKDLYFKGTYLTKIAKNKNTFLDEFWFYVTFGKNRFVNEKDTISNQNYTTISLNSSSLDSVNLIRGVYNSSIETTIENIYGSIDILYNIKPLATKKTNLFLGASFYLGLQNVNYNYNNSLSISDTTMVLKDSLLDMRFRSPLQDLSLTRQLSNVSLGIMHIYSGDKLNIKTNINLGYSVLVFPRSQFSRNGLVLLTEYESSWDPYLQLRIDGTVLTPGISLGFESILRRNDLPLFNVYFSKVINFEKVSSLFTKVESLK